MEDIRFCGQALETQQRSLIVALARLSLFAGVDLTKLLYLKILVLKGLHYTAVTATAGETRGAVILGGGCAGRRNRNASSSRRCSGSGWV